MKKSGETFTLRIDTDLRAKLQKIADEQTEGNVGQLLRKIIREYVGKVK
jgi:predicted transcriptional regulator